MIPLKNGVTSLIGIRFWSDSKLYEITSANEPDSYTNRFSCRVEQVS